MWQQLGEEELVVRFQQFCGLQWTSRKTSDNDIQTESEKHSPDCRLEKRNSKETDFEYNSVIHVMFHLSSALGDEQVLIAVLSFVLWNIDPRAVIRVYLSLTVSIYLGQSAKDTFLAPRPPSPPVVRVEKKYAEEYSMPSTHAMIGLVVPFSLVYFTYENFEYNFYQATFIAAVYSSLVAMSRVYLGMHYVRDVIYGILFESLIMAVLLPILKDLPIETVCQSSPIILSLAVVMPITLLYLYPTSTPISYNTYADTALVLGAAAGALIGLSISAHNEKTMVEFLSKAKHMSNLQLTIFYIMRFAVGNLLLVLTRIISKLCVTSSLSKMLPNDKIAKPLNYKRCVEVPHKLITYALVSINAIYLAPQLFNYCGIS